MLNRCWASSSLVLTHRLGRRGCIITSRPLLNVLPPSSTADDVSCLREAPPFYSSRFLSTLCNFDLFKIEIHRFLIFRRGTRDLNIIEFDRTDIGADVKKKEIRVA